MKIKNKENIKFLPRWSILLLFLMLIGTVVRSAEINETALQKMIRDSQARAAMVEQVREAVVHIRVENSLNRSGNSLQNPSSHNNKELNSLNNRDLVVVP